jgi:mannose-6-phosphate isomerase-like protein (cupin superfamily)
MIARPTHPISELQGRTFMNKISIALAALVLSMIPHTAFAQAAPLPAQRDAVFIAKGDFDRVLAARVNGAGLGVVGAVRGGDDRINVDVLRRIAPDEGPVIHSKVTEIYYILEGGGDFATGGTLVDPKPMMMNGKPSNPASIGPSVKGTSVVGGTSHHVTVGDVVMIPPNIAHGFTRLDGHVTYMVVRVNPDYERDK